MKQTTSQRQAQILSILPELIQKATKAQARFAEMATHFEITQDGQIQQLLASITLIQQTRRCHQWQKYN